MKTGYKVLIKRGVSIAFRRLGQVAPHDRGGRMVAALKESSGQRRFTIAKNGLTTF